MAEQIRKKPRGKQPITRHRLFPATVALWCGAIPSLAGAVAAPRFGVPLILGLGAIGALAGLFLARRIARPKTPAAPGTAVAVAESGSPLWSELRSHRRALEEEQQANLAFAEPPPPAIEREPEILDITLAGSEPLPPEAWDAAVTEPGTEPVTEPVPEPVPEPAVEAAIAPPPQSRLESAAAIRLREADLEDLSHVELLERLALGLERRRGDVVPAGGDTAAAAPTSHVAALRKSYQALVDLAGQVPAPDEDEAPTVFFAPPERRSVVRPAGRAAQATATALAYDPDETAEIADQPQDPAETEKSLRAALAALQRMSGAA